MDFLENFLISAVIIITIILVIHVVIPRLITIDPTLYTIFQYVVGAIVLIAFIILAFNLVHCVYGVGVKRF